MLRKAEAGVTTSRLGNRCSILLSYGRVEVYLSVFDYFCDAVLVESPCAAVCAAVAAASLSFRAAARLSSAEMMS